MRARFLLLAAALLAFGASLGSGFHFDDYAIFSDPALTSPGGWLDLWTLRQTRPLTYLTFWLNYQVGGRDPLGYHVLNLALHLGVVILAYECLRRLLPARAALIAAAIFAVHPIQAEAVNYIWARSIVLATLLALASLLAWIEGRSWVAVAWFAAALLAKEEVAAFPLVLLLLRWSEGDNAPSDSATVNESVGRRKRLPHPNTRLSRLPIASMLLLSLAAGGRAIYATAVTPGAPAGLQAGISPWHYLLAQGPVILRYLRLLMLPWGFTIDPDIRIPATWIGIAAWIAILGAIFLAVRRRSAWSIWLAAGFLLLIPSSSLFPAADLAADRRMYLPLLGFAAAAGLLLERLNVPAIALVPVAGFALVSFGQTAMWMDDASLWRNAAAHAPDKVRPKIQLARALPAAAALEVLAEARNLAPHDPSVAAETGKTLLSEGQTEAALQEFGRALALDPRDARNLNNRGVALEALGQTEAARADFVHALQIDPGLIEARQNLQKLPGR
ncbi:MAG: tetratricopeptide repeat protein [Acidobacteriia bacterium]|nr:tetratricopeptide repeat protein [Terriglobia bacterium]